MSADGTTYTFNLRQGINFSNGDPFNAYQAWAEEYGFYYLSDNSSTWMESYNFFNMAPVDFGPASLALLNSSSTSLINPSSALLAMMENTSWPIYVTGPYQIVFRLQTPFAYFPGAIVVYDGLMFDTQWLLNNGGFGTPTTYNGYFNQHPIPGSGPYVVSQVSEDAYVTFTQNPSYWGDSLTPTQIAAQPLLDPGHAKTVVVNYVPDDLTRYTQLSTGAAQIASILPDDWNLVTANPSEYTYFTEPSWGGEVALMGLNVNDYPTNITLVREAIVHAINYTALDEQAFNNEITPYVGPEYPAWSQYYDLGNYTPYQYNLTLATQEIEEANITSMPTFTFRTVSDCLQCSNIAQVIQADLANINITVNIEVLSSDDYYAPYGTYQTNVQNAAQIGQLSFIDGGGMWGPATVTPADYWVTFVNNQSLWGNWAGYSNPTVQACVNAFTSTTNVTQIQNLCTAAQKQIYQDVPYDWIGVNKLWLPEGGSLVWKSSVVKGFFADPVWDGQTTDPIFNTVTFVS